MRKNSEFLLEGARAVLAVLQSSLEIRELYLSDEEDGESNFFAGRVMAAAAKRGITLRRVSEKEWKKIRADYGSGTTKTPPGFAASAALPASISASDLSPDDSRVLVLDGLSDPGNAGALVRTAYLLGWNAVAVTPGTVGLFAPKAARASAGAAAFLPWISARPATLAAELATGGFTILIGDPSGVPLPNPLPDRLALVLGNESTGPASEWADATKVAVPIIRSPIDSLGVAQSGAILLEMLRFRA